MKDYPCKRCHFSYFASISTKLFLNSHQNCLKLQEKHQKSCSKICVEAKKCLLAAFYNYEVKDRVVIWANWVEDGVLGEALSSISRFVRDLVTIIDLSEFVRRPYKL